MLNSLESNLTEILTLLKAIELTDHQIYTIANVIFSHGQKYEPDPAEFLTFFEELLDSIIQSGAQAQIVLNIIEEKKVSGYIPWFVTELHKRIGGLPAWEKSALKVFKEDINVAKSLLGYYQSNNKTEFVNIARALWGAGLFQYELAGLYFQEMKAEDDSELYRSVILFLLDRHFEMKYYRELQGLMEKEDRLRYIKKFKRNKPGYVEALCMEGKYSEALKFAEQNMNKWNIVEIMTPCIEGQPVAALQVLGQKVEQLLVYERGRDFYESIAQILKIAAAIPAIQKDVKELALKLYNVNTRLRALRSELEIFLS